MCRDISFHGELELTSEVFPELEDLRQLELDKEALIHVRSSIFSPYAVLWREHDRIALGEMEWGVTPTFEKDPVQREKRRLNMVNAQAERIMEDKSSYWYKKKLIDTPVLIPVTNIFEHRHIIGWKRKVPYAVRTNFQPEFSPFYIPGLGQLIEFVDEDGVIQQHRSFTLITCAANEVMCGIHNDGDNKHRMPLFVPLEMAKAWISPKRSAADAREILNYKLPAEYLSYHTVYSINAREARPDGKAKDALWEWPNLPPLGNDSPLNSVSQTSLF